MRGELKGITVAHAMRGRVRLKIPRIKNNPELACRAQEKLGLAPGIQRVEANPLTGSLLILYDPAMLASLEALAPLGETFAELFPEVSLEELAAGLQELQQLSETGDTADASFDLLGAFNPLGNPGLFRDLNLDLLLPLALLFLGGRKLFASKEATFPAWYDYLWIGASALVMLTRKRTEEMK